MGHRAFEVFYPVADAMRQASVDQGTLARKSKWICQFCAVVKQALAS
jgi:hypothetical protein